MIDIQINEKLQTKLDIPCDIETKYSELFFINERLDQEINYLYDYVYEIENKLKEIYNPSQIEKIGGEEVTKLVPTDMVGNINGKINKLRIINERLKEVKSHLWKII